MNRDFEWDVSNSFKRFSNQPPSSIPIKHNVHNIIIHNNYCITTNLRSAKTGLALVTALYSTLPNQHEKAGVNRIVNVQEQINYAIDLSLTCFGSVILLAICRGSSNPLRP